MINITTQELLKYSDSRISATDRLATFAHNNFANLRPYVFVVVDTNIVLSGKRKHVYYKQTVTNANAACNDSVAESVAQYLTDWVQELVNLEDIQSYALKREIPPRSKTNLNNLDTALLFPFFTEQRCRMLAACFLKGTDSHSLALDSVQLKLLYLLNTIYFEHSLNEFKTNHDWLYTELKKIGRLHQMLLPQDDLEIRGFDIHASYKACEHAGGDYYDGVNLREYFNDSTGSDSHDSFGYMIADSAGHGATAAVEIAMFDAILRTYNGSENVPAEVFTYSNKHLFTRLIRGTFITALAINYRAEDDSLHYCNAGHPPPLLFNAATGEIAELNEALGIPLGVQREFVWENAVTRIHSGDVLCLYTDGLIEARGVDNQEYGIDRLRQVLSTSVRKNTAAAIVALIENSIAEYTGGAAQKDDQTLVIIRKI